MWVFWQRAFAWISCHFYVKIWHWFGSLVSVDRACASWVRHCKLPSKNGLSLIQHFLLLVVANWHRLLGRIGCLDWLVFMASFLLPLFVCGVAPPVLCNPFFTSWTWSCAKNLMWHDNQSRGSCHWTLFTIIRMYFISVLWQEKMRIKNTLKKRGGGGGAADFYSQTLTSQTNLSECVICFLLMLVTVAD